MGLFRRKKARAVEAPTDQAAPAGSSSDQAAFGRELLSHFKSTGVYKNIDFNAEGFRLTMDGGTIFLDNVYAQCRANPGSRNEIIKQFVHATISGTLGASDVSAANWREAVFPFLRSRDRIVAYSELGPTVPLEQIGEHFCAGALMDSAETVRFVSDETLGEWGVAFDEVLRVAKENLRGACEGEFEEFAPGAFGFPWQDFHDSARLLFPDLLANLPVHGELVAFAPQPASVFVTGSENAEQFELLFGLAEKMWNEPRSISPWPLILKNGWWEEWRPEPDHPAFQYVRRAAVLHFASMYQDQQARMIERAEASGRDEAYPAAFSVLESDNSQALHSYCVWGAGVRTLLPKTDLVVFVQDPGEGPVAKALWSRVQESLGHLIRPVGMYPERYLVDSFPTAEEIAALNA